jgi:hypothetical protein
LQSVLNENPGIMRVFVVWEPVLKTDWERPRASILNHISDPRARQYWDKQLVVSEQARVVLRDDSEPMEEIVWDFVGAYPPGVRWEDGFPMPAFKGAPVVEVTDGLREYLAANKRK